MSTIEQLCSEQAASMNLDPEIRFKMGANNKARSPKTEEESIGLWVDTRLIHKQFKQPSHTLFSQRMLAPADRFAHLALGTIGPNKFKAKESQKRNKNPRR